MVLLDLSPARRKQREDPVTAKELAGFCVDLGQLMWLATQVVPQLQAPLSLLLGYLGVATVSTLLEANKLARRALVWAQTPLRTFVHEEMSFIGWSDASWACRLVSRGIHHWRTQKKPRLEGWKAQNFALLFSSSAPTFLLSGGLLVEFWCFLKARTSNVHAWSSRAVV